MSTVKEGIQVGLYCHKGSSDEGMLGLKTKAELIMCRGKKIFRKRGTSMSKDPGVGKEQEEKKIQNEVWLEQREQGRLWAGIGR